MDTMDCFAAANGRMAQFTCSTDQVCCGSECCPSGDPFFTHWYFWLAVCMFLVMIIGFGISACRHFRREWKHNSLCAQRGHRTKPEVGNDLLLNYHLMRTETLQLPLYEEVVATDRQNSALRLLTAVNAATTVHHSLQPTPPPPYDDNDDDQHHHHPHDHHSDRQTSKDGTTTYDHPPPSYNQCVMMQNSCTLFSQGSCAVVSLAPTDETVTTSSHEMDSPPHSLLQGRRDFV